MPLLLKDRAMTSSPIALLTVEDCRVLRLSPRSAALHRVRRGVYLDKAEYDKLTPERRYAVRVHAFVLTHPDAILCLESAAVLHGLPSFGETALIHVYDPRRKSSRRTGDVFVHTSQEARQVVEVEGVRVTSLLDTVVDLARVLSLPRALAVSDSAISPVQGGILTRELLGARSEEMVNSRGRAKVRWVWGRSDPLSESPGESVSRAVIEWTGFERPELQREFRYEGQTDRVDFYFPSNRAIGESDGWSKYTLGDPREGADSLRREKMREDRLRRCGRHPFARWDWGATWRVDPLVKILSDTGVRRVGPQQTQMLRTLRGNPRAVPPAPRPR